MALSMPFSKLTQQGEENYPAAYYVVSNFNGTKFNVNFDVGVYEDSTKENKLMNYVYSFEQSMASGSENVIKQAYDYLKTLPDYSSAIDC